jgi:hypothetical protein
MTDEMPEQKAEQDHGEHQLAAERRGWIFSFPGAAGGRPTEGHSIFAAQATLIDVPEDDECKGKDFIGEGDDPLGDLLAKIETFDREHARGV